MPQWYILGTRSDWDSGEPNHYDDPVPFSTDMQLPEGLTCEHCVLMWTWYTGHVCGFDCDACAPFPISSPFFSHVLDLLSESKMKACWS